MTLFPSLYRREAKQNPCTFNNLLYNIYIDGDRWLVVSVGKKREKSTLNGKSFTYFILPCTIRGGNARGTIVQKMFIVISSRRGHLFLIEVNSSNSNKSVGVFE